METPKYPLLDLRPRPPSRRYAGVWVGCVTVAVAAATLFCEAHVTAVPPEQTVMTAAVMILSCFIMYTSLFDAGHQKAEDSQDYTRAQDAYRTVREEIRPRMRELDAFCHAYVEEELASTRAHILERAGLTTIDYLHCRDGELSRAALRQMPRVKRRALRAAVRLKPIRLHPSLLLSGGGGNRRTPRLTAHPARVRRTAVALIPTIIGSMVTVAVTLESMDMTPGAIISGVLRIFTIVWCGVRGYAAGMRALREDDCAVLECKTTLLTAFLSWHPAPAKEK